MFFIAAESQHTSLDIRTDHHHRTILNKYIVFSKYFKRFDALYAC